MLEKCEQENLSQQNHTSQTKKIDNRSKTSELHVILQVHRAVTVASSTEQVIETCSAFFT